MIMIPNPTDDIVERLKFWRDLPPGTSLPPDTDNTWASLISDVCAAAIEEVETLRARVRDLGWLAENEMSFRKIKEQLGR